MPFDNFFAYSLAGGTAIAPTDPGTGTGASTNNGSIPTDGLVSYWTMDEESGDRVDSVGGITLTDVNGVGSRTGIVGNEAVFDVNQSQYLEAQNLVLPTNFTISGWLIVDSETQSNYCLVGDFNSAHSGFSIQYSRNPNYHPNRIMFRTYTGANYAGETMVLSDPMNYAFGDPIHIVASYKSDTGEMRLVVNNSSAYTGTTITGGIPSAPDPILIGANRANNSNLTDFVNGSIDELGIWNRVLTEQEISDLYNNGSGTTYQTK